MKRITIPKIIIGIYCIAFLVFVNHFAVNMPYQDDANLIEPTMPGMSFKALILNFFSADSDHIQVYPKLTTYFQYKIFGLVNFKQLTIFMNLLVIISLFHLVNISKKGLNYLYFLPVFVLILQPQLFEISFWVLPGLQHSYAMLFTVLAIYFLDLNKKYNWLSLFMAASATFCTGNGLLAFFGIMYVLVLYRKPIWYALAAFILSFSVYLLSYKPSAAVRNKIDITNIINFQIMFWTSPFEVFNRLYLHYLVGIILIISILLLFGMLSKKIFISKNSADLPIAKLFSILIFCGGTALLISLSREYDVIFSRFQFYAFFGFACLYLIVLEVLDKPFRQLFAIGAGGLFVIISLFSFYTNYVKIENMSNRYTADTYNWANNKVMMMVDQPYLALANRIYNPTNGKTFKITDDLISKKELNMHLEKNTEKWPFEKLDLKMVKDTYPRRYFYDEHFLLGAENFNQKDQISESWYMVFANRNINYILPLEFNCKFKAAFLKTNLYYEKGFLTNITTLNFRPETYQIYLLKKDEKSHFNIYDTMWEINFLDKTPSLIYK